LAQQREVRAVRVGGSVPKDLFRGLDRGSGVCTVVSMEALTTYSEATDEQVLEGFETASNVEAKLYGQRPYGSEPSHEEKLAESVGAAWMAEGMKRGLI
jgi:hypothetical protein